ncbi:hypothetical protein FE257_005969 [Aspergillus nanangensis]|uniref:Uncharacterized protein n=1 Tax=Aspergillus nanangensis TaxID=2582783 RepID=A0AAD4CB34_ASPNN|nr:hypothetical protein FE257_005969 [Aspergillus nanangensis]
MPSLKRVTETASPKPPEGQKPSKEPVHTQGSASEPFRAVTGCGIRPSDGGSDPVDTRTNRGSHRAAPPWNLDGTLASGQGASANWRTPTGDEVEVEDGSKSRGDSGPPSWPAPPPLRIPATHLTVAAPDLTGALPPHWRPSGAPLPDTSPARESRDRQLVNPPTWPGPAGPLVTRPADLTKSLPPTGELALASIPQESADCFTSAGRPIIQNQPANWRTPAAPLPGQPLPPGPFPGPRPPPSPCPSPCPSPSPSLSLSLSLSLAHTHTDPSPSPSPTGASGVAQTLRPPQPASLHTHRPSLAPLFVCKRSGVPK